MSNSPLIHLIDSVLGQGKSTARGNRAYHCPECKHHKLKLEINLDDSSSNFQSYQCWVCGFKGKKLSSLFRKLSVDSDKLNQLKLLTNSQSSENKNEVNNVQEILLPDEFIPLLSSPLNNLVAKKALHYLKTRNITKEDIIKYNIGYCEYGPYSNMIVIPSYDNKGKLNYFFGRSFEPGSSLKKNPPISRNIIPFELFINWNVPVILCEGMFDAMAIKRNAIPLLGKNMQSNLLKQLIKSSVQKIYIALDKDAIKQSLNFCEKLMNEGKEVYLIDLQDKDPSEMGFEKFTILTQNTKPLTLSNLIEKKLHII